MQVLKEFATFAARKSKTLIQMKRLFCLLCCFFVLLIQCMAVRYSLYYVTSNVNLRDSPFLDSEVICVIPAGSNVIVTEYEHVKFDSGFGRTLYIDENIKGWASTKHMKFIQDLTVDENGVFTKTGESYETDPQLDITNKTSKPITVTINGKDFSFGPGAKQRIECEAGTVSVMASAPGVIPYIGKDYVEGNSTYSWEFFIRTTYNHVRHSGKNRKRK